MNELVIYQFKTLEIQWKEMLKGIDWLLLLTFFVTSLNTNDNSIFLKCFEATVDKLTNKPCQSREHQFIFLNSI